MYMAPLAAFTMATLLFAYTRSSIRAAKLSVEKHKEQGGGKVNWAIESRRQHGQIEKISDIEVIKESVLGKREPNEESSPNETAP